MKLLFTLLAIVIPQPTPVLQVSAPAPKVENITLTWSALAGVHSYSVAIYAANWSVLKDTGSQTRLLVTGLTNSIWVGVHGVSNNVSVAQTAMLQVKIPPTPMAEVWSARTLEGPRTILLTYTNMLQNESGFVGIRRWKDYTP